MGKFEIKDTGLYKKIDIFKKLLRVMKVKPFYFVIQVFSSFIIAFFDGINIVLLVPLAKGVIEMNFSFLKEVPVFETIIAHFPELFIKASFKFMFILLIGTIFIVAAIKNVLQYLSFLYISYQNEKQLLNLKRFVLERYLSFGKLFFDNASKGAIFTVLNFSEYARNLLYIFADILKTFFTLSVYLIIMIAISWKLTIFVAIVFPILHYSVKWIIKKIEITAELYTATSLKLNREVFSILSCIPLIKAYNKEREVGQKYAEITDILRQQKFSLEKKRGLIDPIQETILLATLLLLLSATLFILRKDGSIEISKFLAFFYLLRRIIPTFASFNDIKVSFASINTPLEEVLKTFNDRDKFFVSEGKMVFSGLKREIEFNHLNFYYDVKSIPIIKDLTFRIEKDKITAIVGPTGAGKTTIINLVMRFYDCRPGAIFVDGVDIRKFTSKSLREHIALVSQEVLVFNDTLRRNITFGIEEKVAEEKLIDITKKARLYDFIMKLSQGFDTEVGDRGVKLSGGERQRVSIARALLKGSEILILDEATNSLDTHTERLIQEAIEEAIKDRTTIVVAHRLSTIKNADKIVVIEDGKSIEEGMLNGLLEKKGKFYQYWQEQKFY